MTGRRPRDTACPGASPTPPPVPAGMPDQQVQDGEDPMDVPEPPDTDPAGDAQGFARELPELDESGSGGETAGNPGAHPGHPVPDESPG